MGIRDRSLKHTPPTTPLSRSKVVSFFNPIDHPIIPQLTSAMRLLMFLSLVASHLLSPASEFPPASQLPNRPGLPDPLLKPDGTTLQSTSDWPAQRGFLKQLLATYQYGHMPERPDPASVALEITSEKTIGDGTAELIHFTITLHRNNRSLPIRAALLKPATTGSEKLPTIVKNAPFLFDYETVSDPRKRKRYQKQNHLESELRVLRQATDRGYLVCKFLRGDAAGDAAPNPTGDVFGLYPENKDWRVISAWAWTGSVIADTLIRHFHADPTKLVATGHSRGGKSALCQGIYDERIAITAPNASGSGGAGSWRYFTPGGARQTPSTFARQNPRWFTPRLYEFTGELVGHLPFDSHTMKALIAPRHLINTQASDDSLANPRGTQFTFQAAQKIFGWLGVPENQALHWRPGGHQQAAPDWIALLDFADSVFFAKPLADPKKFQHLPLPDESPETAPPNPLNPSPSTPPTAQD